MNRLVIFSALVSLSIVAGCENRQKTKYENIGTREKGRVEFSNADSLSYMELNAGAKWQANKETTEGIEAMIAIVQNHSGHVGSDSLKNSLQTEMNTIFQKCSMKGEAHEQLHGYLLPLKEKIAVLGDENVEKDIVDIGEYLSKYWFYFQ